MQNILFLLNSQGFSPSVKFLIIAIAVLLMVIILILKGLSLWYSSKHNERGWFIAILVLNTLGLLELVYLFFFEKDKKLKHFILSKFKKN